MIKKFLKVMDYSLVIIILILFGIGITALYSASGGIDGDYSEVVKQLIWLGVGIVAIIVILFVDYETIGKLWIPAYILCLILLVAVLFTHPINGASSWFKIKGIGFQPSEITKIVLIVSLAKVIDYYKKKDTLNNPISILIILALIMIPVLLIIKQPDYGTAMVILVMSIVMLFAGGIKWRYIIGAFSFAIIMLPLLYMFVLPQHAKDRIAVFLNPQLDPRGKGYNVIQSKLAVGSGQLWGMGLFNGNQTQLGILPMKKTDFIYSVISEEMGFIIAALVIILFVALLYKIIGVAKTAKNSYGALIAVGVAGMFLAHFAENIGMTMGLLPITGIPLPFISYGGSSLLTNFIAIGLVLNVSARRQRMSLFE